MQHSNKTPKQIVGLYIKQQRHWWGYSQKELADAVGISTSSIGAYERGQRMPDIILGLMIGAILGFNWDELVSKLLDTVLIPTQSSIPSPENAENELLYGKQLEFNSS